MSYLVLARKWRPKSFDTLVGQDHVVRALTHALTTQRLHHAWLFTGTRGVGKTTLSRILAKSLNCETGITARPCGQCRACTEIDAGRFVDYVELDAASNRGVDEMTQLLEQAAYAPSAARFKVYMIDEVHMLSGHAFNAMLKTLEEPPPYVKFILATTDPQKIPPTVLSRCLQFNLKQMSADSIVGHLSHVLQQEAVPFEPQALWLIAQAASGSMRDALSLTDQAIAYSAGSMTDEAVRGMLGTIDQRHLVRLLDALLAQDGAAILAVADELAVRGLSYAGALGDLAVLLSRVAVAQRVPAAIAQEDPLAADIARLAQTMDADAIQLFYTVAVHSRGELALAPDEYAGFVMAVLRMLSLAVAAGGAVAAPGAGGLPAPVPQGSTATAVGSGSAQARVAQEPPAGVASQTETRHSSAAKENVGAAAVPGQGAEQAASIQEPAAAAEPIEAPNASMVPLGDAAAEQGAKSAVDIVSPRNAAERTVAASSPDPVAASAEDLPWHDELPAAVANAAAPKPEQAAEIPVQAVPAAADDAAAKASAAELVPPPQESSPPVQSAQQAQQADDGMPPWEMDIPAFPPSGDDLSRQDEPEGATARPARPASRAAASRPVAAPRRAAAAGSGEIRLDRPWHEVAADLPLSGLASELARHSEWKGVNGRTIRLRVAARTLAEVNGRDRLKQCLSDYFGCSVNLDIEVAETGDGTAYAVDEAVRVERQRVAEETVHADPFVQELERDFGARVYPGSVKAVMPEAPGH